MNLSPAAKELLDQCFIENFKNEILLIAADALEESEVPGVPLVMRSVARLQSPWQGRIPNQLPGGVKEFHELRKKAVAEHNKNIKDGWDQVEIPFPDWRLVYPGPHTYSNKRIIKSTPPANFTVVYDGEGTPFLGERWIFMSDTLQWKFISGQTKKDVAIVEVPVIAKLVVLAAKLVSPYWSDLQLKMWKG